jgi:hypothetical protein
MQHWEHRTDLDILERDVGCARRPHALALHLGGLDTTHLALDEEHRQALRVE